MLDFVADVRSGQVVVEAEEVVVNLDFVLVVLLFVLSLDVDLFDETGQEEVGVEGDFAVLQGVLLPGRLARVDENRGTDDAVEYLGNALLVIFVIDEVEDDKEVELDAFVVVGGAGELEGGEEGVAGVDRHFRHSLQSHVHQVEVVGEVDHGFHCEHLSDQVLRRQ